MTTTVVLSCYSALHFDLLSFLMSKDSSCLRRPLFMTARSAAQTSIYCAVAKELDAVSGKYFRRCRVSRESSLACDRRLAAQLWHVCSFVYRGTSLTDHPRSGVVCNFGRVCMSVSQGPHYTTIMMPPKKLPPNMSADSLR